MSEVHAFYTDDKLRAALADPALESLADGPAKDLFTWLAVNTGQYGAFYKVVLLSDDEVASILSAFNMCRHHGGANKYVDDVEAKLGGARQEPGHAPRDTTHG